MEINDIIREFRTKLQNSNFQELDYLNKIEDYINLQKKNNYSCNKNNKIYNNIFDKFNTAIRIIDNDLTIIKVNNSFAKIFNKSIEYFEGKKCFEVECYNFCNPVNCKLNNIINKNLNIEEDVEYEIDGKINSFILNIKPIFDLNGNNIGVVEEIKNITSRKNIVNELIELNSKYNLITENSSDVILLVDNNDILTFASPSFKKIYGYEFDNLKSQSIKLFFNEASYSELHQKCSNLLINSKNIENFKIEQVHKRSNETTFWAEIIATLIKNENQNNCLLIIIRDITDRKLMELAMYESEHFNKSIIDASPNCIKILDLEGKVQFINEKGIEILELENAFDFIGKDYITLWKPEYYDNIKNAINDALNNKIGSFSGTFQVNNIEKWFDINISPIKNTKQEMTDLLVISSDITHLKKSEEKINAQNLILQDLNATKDKFFSIISHDLKNPFSTIIGFSDLILNQIDKIDKNKIEKYVTAINQGSKTAHLLLENLLEWSSSQTGKIAYIPKNININSIILDVINMIQSNAISKNIKIEFDNNEQINLFGDENMLRTVFRNLISNAIKFSYEASKIIILIFKDNDNLTVVIKDFGVGIASELISKLFIIGQNISTYGTNSEKGTGLGLILCKEFVEKHGGKIWVESEINKGSEFKFTIKC